MARLETFRQDSSRYAVLIDPTVQITHLSQADIADLVECLDYSRLSTAPRRNPQGGASEQRPLVSNLPSPFFDDFLNLLPLNNSGRPGDLRFSGVFADDDYFASMPGGPSTRPVNLPTPPPTTAATTIPSTNSSCMHYSTNINSNGNVSKGGSEGANHNSSSASRTTFSQNREPSPTNNPFSQHQHEPHVFSHYQQKREHQQPLQPLPNRPPSFHPLHALPQPSSYLPHLTSPPLLTSTTAIPATNTAAMDPRPSQRNSIAPPILTHIDSSAEQHQPPYRRLSSSSHGKSAVIGARRPWYEQSQPRQMGSMDDDDGARQMGMGGGEGGMMMTGFVSEGRLR